MPNFYSAVLVNHREPLRIVETPAVTPPSGHLTVDVDFAGVCGTDVHLTDGRLPVPLPLVLGHEAVGRVRALGSGVTEDTLGAPLAVGDAVTWASNIACGSCFYCVEEQERSLCGNRKVYGINLGADDWPGGSGGYGQQMLLQPGTTLVRLPDALAPEQVVALGCAGPTVVHGLFGPARPSVGDTVVVQGSGPVGLASAMYAKLAGAATVIMVGAPAARLELATSIGACDVAIDITEMTDAADRIAAVTKLTPGGRGADLVVEATGFPPAVEEGMRLCRRNGRFLVLGQYTDHGQTPLNPHLITKGQLRVYGSWAFSGADYVKYVSTLPRLAERFDLRRLVTTFTLDAANEALQAMRDGTVMKAVLTPSASFGGEPTEKAGGAA
jgi:D-arabinose 1-dehydrogenase-like Zn-dependent alcohol dehydrogenase